MVKLYWVMLWRLRRSWLLLKRTTCTKYRKSQHAGQHRDGRPTIRHSQIPKMKIKHDRYQFDYWLPCKEWECNSNRLLVRFLPLNPGRTPGAHAFTKVEFKTPYKFAFFCWLAAFWFSQKYWRTPSVPEKCNYVSRRIIPLNWWAYSQILSPLKLVNKFCETFSELLTPVKSSSQHQYTYDPEYIID